VRVGKGRGKLVRVGGGQGRGELVRVGRGEGRGELVRVGRGRRERRASESEKGGVGVGPVGVGGRWERRTDENGVGKRRASERRIQCHSSPPEAQKNGNKFFLAEIQ